MAESFPRRIGIVASLGLLLTVAVPAEAAEASAASIGLPLAKMQFQCWFLWLADLDIQFPVVVPGTGDYEWHPCGGHIHIHG